jgi:hypothetical protein
MSFVRYNSVSNDTDDLISALIICRKIFKLELKIRTLRNPCYLMGSPLTKANFHRFDLV